MSIHEVGSMYNQPSVYNHGGGGGGGSVDYQPIPEAVKNLYERLTFIRSDVETTPYIAANIPLDFDDKLTMTIFYDRPFNPAGQQYLFQNNDATFFTKFFSGPVIATGWNDGVPTDYNASYISEGTINLVVDKDHYSINGHTYSTNKGAAVNTIIRKLCYILNTGNQQQLSFFKLKTFDHDGNLKYSVYPARRIADSKLGVYCEQLNDFWTATSFSEAGPVIE